MAEASPESGTRFRIFAARLFTGRRPGRAALPVFASAFIVGAATMASIVLQVRPLLVWNASRSSQRGLYLVTHAASLGHGDMAIAWPPEAARRLAAARHYLPSGVPLVKLVAAASGDRVCARDAWIRINDRIAAERRLTDAVGRPMPRWTGCERLQADQLFLLGTAGSGSFDGRYFGATGTADLVGKAQLLWAR